MELRNGDFCWVWFAETNDIWWGVVVDNKICYQNGEWDDVDLYWSNGNWYFGGILIATLGGIVRGCNCLCSARHFYEQEMDDKVTIIRNGIDDKYDEIYNQPLKMSISDIEAVFGREIYITA